MTLTERDKAFLLLYKGNDNNKVINTIHPEMDFAKKLFYEACVKNENINYFLHFISHPNPKILQKLNIHFDYLEEMIEMILTIIRVSCEYASENPINRKTLYRFENNANIQEYEKGETNSLKSTSRLEEEASVFNRPDTTGLIYQVEGFVPYISIDSIVSAGHYSDEREILFPPFIDVTLTDEHKEENGRDHQVIKVKNKTNDLMESMLMGEDINNYQEAIQSFTNIFRRDQREGIVSDELKELCSIIHQYIRNYSLEMYKMYEEMSQKKSSISEIEKTY